MAMLGRKEPAPTTQQPAVRKDSRVATTAVAAKPGRLDRLREQFRNIAAELRKVTWPTPEETRNLTIVVIGLTAVVGTGLYILDTVFEWLYQLPR
ncbi:MAG TPA: preprotein translocase subunit SecE [Chloroflexia bacterium]|nr:preprotein translocase subunit SecE [Chloroflexia bacterium]